MIKGVAEEDIEEQTDELLTSVGLLEVKNARVMNYSGGMKRRLSVAISSIGNPKIIFMDEPTTGMDPVSRRDVWTLIQRHHIDYSCHGGSRYPFRSFGCYLRWEAQVCRYSAVSQERLW